MKAKREAVNLVEIPPFTRFLDHQEPGTYVQEL
jgi:hypothetical protein